MKIKVTQENIEAGIAREARACPVALAMVDAGLEHPSVRNCYVHWWSGESDDCWAQLPAIAQKAVADFDYTGEIDPFEFELPEK